MLSCTAGSCLCDSVSWLLLEMQVEEPIPNEPKFDRKYTFTELYNYLSRREYPPDASKQYKLGIRKRSRKYFIIDEGRLYYIGGQKKNLLLYDA